MEQTYIWTAADYMLQTNHAIGASRHQRSWEAKEDVVGMCQKWYDYMQPGWCQPVRQEFMENECEALPGVAYPGVRDNCSTLNTKTGYDETTHRLCTNILSDLFVWHCYCFIDNDCWELMVDCCSAVRQKYTSKGQDSKVLSRDVVMFMCRVPDITIATDVICGFPTETVEVWVTVLCLL